MLSNFLIMLLTLFGTLLFLLVPPGYWLFGLVLIMLVWLLFLLFVIPRKPVQTRGWWTLSAFFMLLAATTAWIALSILETNSISINLIGNAYDLIPYLDARILVFFVGAIVSLVLTPLFFLLVVYVSTVYVMGLPQEEDLTFWHAFRLTLYLLLNLQLPWLLVENGEIIPLREKGFLKTGASLGKIIVKAGNALVLEKGGKITRIVGPGTIITTPNERIRSEQAFDLRPQFVALSVESVITADRIPLTIELGVSYRLKPAENPLANSVLKESNFNAYPVEMDTLKKATFNTTAGGWKGFANGAPITQLRDQFMCYTLDELFEISFEDIDKGSSSEPRVNARQIKKIEDAILQAIKLPAPNFGVEFSGVDIRQIFLPRDVWEKVIEVALYNVLNKEVETKWKRSVAQIKAEAQEFEAEAAQNAARMKADAILELARANAQAEVIRGRGKAEAKAEYYRHVLEVLQAYGHSSPEIVNTVLKSLGRAISSENDIKQLTRLLRYTDDRELRRRKELPELSPDEDEDDDT